MPTWNSKNVSQANTNTNYFPQNCSHNTNNEHCLSAQSPNVVSQRNNCSRLLLPSLLTDMFIITSEQFFPFYDVTHGTESRDVPLCTVLLFHNEAISVVCIDCCKWLRLAYSDSRYFSAKIWKYFYKVMNVKQYFLQFLLQSADQ